MKYLQLFSIFILVLFASSALADKMSIHLKNGKVINYNTNNINKITYQKSKRDMVFQLDSTTNQSRAIGHGYGLLENFELTGTIRIEKGYRNNGTSWAGFLIRADKENAQHGKSNGYLCFIRKNGEVGIHSSGIQHIKVQRKTNSSSLQDTLIRIVARNDNIKVYVNHKLILNERGAYLSKGYISLNVGGSRSTFTIKSIKRL